jgi:hypothetical protein
MSLPLLDARLQQRHGDPNLIGKELIWQISDTIKHDPRSMQRTLGPSEIGDPCARRIAYKLLQTSEVRERPPNWPATVGHGVHLWLADAFAPIEVDQGQERWFVETKLVVGEIDGHDIKGSCDLYDRVTATVIDWKTTSKAKIEQYRKRGPGNLYRAQINLYGRGWRRIGQPVDTVMIVFLPRDGGLDDAYVWHEAYDDQCAVDALTRLQGIARLVGIFGVDALGMLPTTEAYCLHCPYLRFNSSNLAEGCPGDPATLQPRAVLTVEGK